MVHGFPFEEHVPPGAVWDFYFIRHGESEGNKDGIIQGHLDYPLSPAGRSHAAAAGEWFEQIRPAAILTSPLGRAVQTARIIAGEAGFPARRITILEDLKEINTGVFTGRKVTDIRREDPRLWDEFVRRSWTAVPESESIPDLEARAHRVWSEVCTAARSGSPSASVSGSAADAASPNERPGALGVLCVSHAGMIQWIIKATFGAGYACWMPVVRVGNCGVFHFRVKHTAGGGIYDESKPESGKAPQVQTGTESGMVPQVQTGTESGKTPEMQTDTRSGKAPEWKPETVEAPALSCGLFMEWMRMNFLPYGG